MKKFSFFILTVMSLLVISPMFLYWWGLSNLESEPVPVKLSLHKEKELEIWLHEKEVGTPSIKEISPYGYIAYFYCNVANGVLSKVCSEKYPGLRVGAFSIRKQVSEQVRGQGNTVWQITWAAYTIWVTKNWNIHQILATYNAARNT